jgi:glyoxylase-like metal-dependent hydrolase (beta-lactamase superfamily II)
VAIHEQDAPMLNDPQKNLSVHWGENLSFPEADIKLNDGDIFKLGNKEITVIHTPGHSLGGICLFVDDLLFCGDTFFAGSIGRTDLPGGNYQTLINSIQKKLFDLGDQVTAFPGHGPETTIGQEKVSNPFAGLNA